MSTQHLQQLPFTEHPAWVWHWAKCSKQNNSFNPHNLNEVEAFHYPDFLDEKSRDSQRAEITDLRSPSLGFCFRALTFSRRVPDTPSHSPLESGGGQWVQRGEA